MSRRALAAPLLAAVCTAFFLAPARADGLVQITFQGEIYSPGGRVVSVQVERALSDSALREVDLTLHIGYGTTALDVAALLAEHLRRGGFDVLEPPATPGKDSASLFVEQVRKVTFQAGAGLRCRVTSCEQAPANVRILPPADKADGCSIRAAVSYFLPHNGERGMLDVEVDASELATAPWISEQLANRGISAGIVCSRPTLDAWRVDGLLDGGRITGCSISLLTEGAWTLEFELQQDELPR